MKSACAAAKISRMTAYRRRKENKKFAREWDDARSDAVDTLQGLAWKRASEGSDYMLRFLLESLGPDVFGQKSKVSVTISHEARISALQDVGFSKQEAEDAIAEAEIITRSR